MARKEQGVTRPTSELIAELYAPQPPVSPRDRTPADFYRRLASEKERYSHVLEKAEKRDHQTARAMEKVVFTK